MIKEFLNRFNITLIIIFYSAIILSLYAQLNFYVVLFGVLCALWRSANFYGLIRLMPGLLLSIVALTASAMTMGLLYQQGIFSIMLHLVFLGFSLKFLELKSVRDVYFFVNTGFVLIALFFVFYSSVLATLIASFLLLLLLAILLTLHIQVLPKNTYLRLLIKSCLLSLPLAILLFIVVPRLPTLWKMPTQKQATTGLSDSITPGNIASLSRSSELAFRATFNGPAAPESERYWRAMTLDHFDGKTWSQSTATKREEVNAKTGSGLRFYQTESNEKMESEYELIIEPHYNYWVPVLDYTTTPQGLVSLSDYSLRSDKPIVTRKTITVVKMGRVKMQKLTTAQRLQYTQLPMRGNKQTDDWISKHLKDGVNKENILLKLLNSFSQRFRYTLRPPLLGQQQIDDFLFNTQSGFCVHFASSYLYVARRLGFAARMVTGYLGGEWQASEEFLSIRQYDAHAWVEIWRDNGWQRVDPTSYVAPERIESGLQAALTDQDEFLAGEYFSLQRWRSIKVINLLRERLAQVDYLWARYVVNFDNQSQLKLMQRWLTNMPWLKLTYAVMLMMVFIFSVLLIVILKPWKIKKISIEDKVYIQLQAHFNKRGFNRVGGQSISEYCLQLGEKFSLSDVLCQSFAVKYNAIKYQPNQSRDKYNKQLKQLLFISRQLKKK